MGEDYVRTLELCEDLFRDPPGAGTPLVMAESGRPAGGEGGAPSPERELLRLRAEPPAGRSAADERRLEVVARGPVDVATVLHGDAVVVEGRALHRQQS